MTVTWIVVPPKKRTRNSRFSLVFIEESGDSVPRTPWDFSLWACSGGDRPWAGGLPGGDRTRRLQGCIGAQRASPQSSILRCNIDSLGYVDFTVNYSFKLCFILARRLVSQCAVQTLVTVVNLDVFEDLAPCLGPAAEDLIVRKTLCFQRAEERFHRCIIITISYPAHALLGPDNTQRFAHSLATILAASIGVKVQALIGLAQNQGISERRNNQFCLQALAQFPAYHSAAEQIQDHRQVKPSLQRGDIGDVTGPDLIWSTRLELLDQVGRRSLARQGRPWPKRLLASSS